MNKRGLSGVVTTVIIILLVLAVVAIIWATIRPALDPGSYPYNPNLPMLPFGNESEDNRIVYEGNITCKLICVDEGCSINCPLTNQHETEIPN